VCRSYATTSGSGTLTAYVIYVTDGTRYGAVAVSGTERVRTYLWDGTKFEGN
jgi:hypothetical protein